jgi:hypothetical protein
MIYSNLGSNSPLVASLVQEQQLSDEYHLTEKLPSRENYPKIFSSRNISANNLAKLTNTKSIVALILAPYLHKFDRQDIKL